MASTVGGTSYGVARKVNLVSVRVLGCDARGSVSGILGGFDWVARNAQHPAVLLAAYAGEKTAAVNGAVEVVAGRGVLPVVPAGDFNADACLVSPASASRAVTVGATNAYGEETSFSDSGECLHQYAPAKTSSQLAAGGSGAVTLTLRRTATGTTGTGEFTVHNNHEATP
ncbi:S8 family serine peptidase [Streptomyces sp. NPDC097981]|uniref:S8 family serine peptidase n=1 Tax=Streptomyces sp. NPDC097981 TaxID=3155428 RepID=UPI003326AFF7